MAGVFAPGFGLPADFFRAPSRAFPGLRFLARCAAARFGVTAVPRVRLAAFFHAFFSRFPAAFAAGRALRVFLLRSGALVRGFRLTLRPLFFAL